MRLIKKKKNCIKKTKYSIKNQYFFIKFCTFSISKINSFNLSGKTKKLNSSSLFLEWLYYFIFISANLLSNDWIYSPSIADFSFDTINLLTEYLTSLTYDILRIFFNYFYFNLSLLALNNFEIYSTFSFGRPKDINSLVRISSETS